MKVKQTEEIVAALEPIARELGVELYEVVFKQGKHPSLTIFLDTEKEGGIDLNTCEAFHNAADPVLDELDPTYGQPYTLNVSSPGLDRPFKKEAIIAATSAKRWRSSCTRLTKEKNFSTRCCLNTTPPQGT